MRALLAIVAVALAIGVVALWLAVRRPAPAQSSGDAAPQRHEPVVSAVSDAVTTADASAAISVDATTALPEQFATLRASGSANEVWVSQGMAVLDAVGAGSDLGCFVAACGGVFVFASQADYTQRRATVEASTAYAAWTGGKRWTDVEQLRDGRVRVALLLYRPD